MGLKEIIAATIIVVSSLGGAVGGAHLGKRMGENHIPSGEAARFQYNPRFI